MSCSPASKRWLPDVPRWVAAGQKIQKLISSWLTRSAIKEAKVKIVHLNDIDNCTVYITPTSCLCWPFTVNHWSHCFYTGRSGSKQQHDSAKGEGNQLRSRLQGVPWLVHEMETSPCYFHEKVRRLWLRRHGRQGSGIPSLRVESQTALQLGVQPHPEHGRNPDEIRVASHKNTGNQTVPILSCRSYPADLILEAHQIYILY